MPALNVRDVTEDQMQGWKASAASQGKTLREWVVERLDSYGGQLRTPRTAEATPPAPAPARTSRPPVDLSLPDVPEEIVPRIAAPSIHTGSYARPTHDAAVCRVYGCLMCRAAGKRQSDPVAAPRTRR